MTEEELLIELAISKNKQDELMRENRALKDQNERLLLQNKLLNYRNMDLSRAVIELDESKRKERHV